MGAELYLLGGVRQIRLAPDFGTYIQIPIKPFLFIDAQIRHLSVTFRVTTVIKHRCYGN